MDNNLIVYGRNAVSEAIKSQQDVNALYVQKDGKGLGEYFAAAKKFGLVVKQVDVRKLDELAEGNRHGGVAVALSAVQYATVEEILRNGEAASDKPPFILIL
jgi:23S rRNA (guanosine2251-2'-O)-methyltransferase